MIVYVVVKSDWNDEYGYEEYRVPLKIFASEQEAQAFKNVYVLGKTEEIYVIPYKVE